MPTADEFDIDEAAAMPFGPSAGPEILRQFDAGPWRRECTDAGIDLRIAAMVLAKTKDELTAFARGIGQDTFHAELDRLLDRQKRSPILPRCCNRRQAD